MTNLAFFTTFVAYHLVNLLQYAMLARAILSWIMPGEDNGLIRVLYAVTEPLVAFVRKILYRLNIGAEGPIDFSFLGAVLLLTIAQYILHALL